MNSEFTITLEIEVKLIINIITTSTNNNAFIATSSILLNDIVFNIVTDVLQIKGTNETIVIV